MKTQISIVSEDNNFVVGITDDSGEYFIWQLNVAENDNVHFECNDQINGGYNTVQECTVMKDGIHLVIQPGEMLHFYFNEVSDEEYKILIQALKKIYIKHPSVLEVSE